MDYKILLTTWVIPVISLLITVAFGWYAISSSNKQSQQINKNVEQTERILKDTELVFQHLTTRHIGNFPNFFQNIIECLSSAKKEIHIACDFPAYGIFSNRKLCNTYLTLLRNAQTEGINVRIVTMSDYMFDYFIKHQFKDNYESITVAKENQEFAQKLALFEKLEDVTISNFDELNEKLRDIHNRTFYSSEFATEKYKLHTGMPLYCWIADGHRAVFSIPTWDKDVTSQGFETRDESLCKGLISAWNLYAEQGEKVSRT